MGLKIVVAVWVYGGGYGGSGGVAEESGCGDNDGKVEVVQKKVEVIVMTEK